MLREMSAPAPSSPVGEGKAAASPAIVGGPAEGLVPREGTDGEQGMKAGTRGEGSTETIIAGALQSASAAVLRAGTKVSKLVVQMGTKVCGFGDDNQKTSFHVKMKSPKVLTEG